MSRLNNWLKEKWTLPWCEGNFYNLPRSGNGLEHKPGKIYILGKLFVTAVQNGDRPVLSPFWLVKGGGTTHHNIETYLQKAVEPRFSEVPYFASLASFAVYVDVQDVFDGECQLHRLLTDGDRYTHSGEFFTDLKFREQALLNPTRTPDFRMKYLHIDSCIQTLHSAVNALRTQHPILAHGQPQVEECLQFRKVRKVVK